MRRADILADTSGINTINGITYVNPIIDWSVDDIWRYIAQRGLDYCPVYDVMDRIGVGRRRARVGPLPLSDGSHLWKGWPQTYIQLLTRYGRRWRVPTRRPHHMDMLTWIEIRDVLETQK